MKMNLWNLSMSILRKGALLQMQQRFGLQKMVNAASVTIILKFHSEF